MSNTGKLASLALIVAVAFAVAPALSTHNKAEQAQLKSHTSSTEAWSWLHRKLWPTLYDQAIPLPVARAIPPTPAPSSDLSEPRREVPAACSNPPATPRVSAKPKTKQTASRQSTKPRTTKVRTAAATPSARCASSGREDFGKRTLRLNGSGERGVSAVLSSVT
jgi:hypothetical protein